MQSNHTTTNYRPDIDGLRAIAVMAVVLFHFSNNALRGGFVGVDIFFIISGFLITSHLLSSIRSNSFSFVDFYIRRINRLFPALLLVAVTCLIFGWFALYDDEFRKLGYESFSGLLFFPNLAFLKETGYFDVASELKPLLHLWSLGVEEQFYFLWPILLLLFRKRNPKIIIAVIGTTSFLLNLFLVRHQPEVAFYLPFSRFWEMLLGATIASQVLKSQEQSEEPAKEVKSVFGLLLILVSFFVINRHRATFPGFWALMPALGAYLIISAGPNARINKKFLSHPFMVFIGLISYPLYLWHWPLLYVSTVLGRGSPTMWMRGAAVGISFVLAWLTYKFLEKPVRHLVHLKKVTSTRALFAAAMVLATLSFMASRGDNGNHHDKSFLLGEKLNELTVHQCGLDQSSTGLTDWCMSDKRGPANAVIFGDSHAHALYPGLLQQSSDSIRWALIARAGCAPLLETMIADSEIDYKSSESCSKLAQAAVHALVENKKIKLVLISVASFKASRRFRTISNGSILGTESLSYFYGLSKVIEALRASGKEVALVIDNPGVAPNPEFCMPRPFEIKDLGSEPKCSISRAEYDEQTSFMRATYQRLEGRYPDVRIFDPSDVYCNQRECSVLKDGRSLFSYTNHLSDFANNQVAEAFMKWLSEKKIIKNTEL